MTNDLRPCPFCGGEAHAALAAYAGGATAHVVCDACGAKVYGYGSGERGLRDATGRWNRRAGRTYHPKGISTAYHSAIVCSECKHRLDEVTIYCPNCGARLEGVGR